VYDRQLLLFELDHGGATPDVLARADAALAVRGDIFGWDVVAWAHFRLGQYAEASAAMRHALATGCRDARLLFHAGAIAQASGDRSGAERLLNAALSLGPALDPRQTDEARSLLAAIAAAP
jgi:Flp pilus assembly protein TadD